MEYPLVWQSQTDDCELVTVEKNTDEYIKVFSDFKAKFGNSRIHLFTVLYILLNKILQD